VFDHFASGVTGTVGSNVSELANTFDSLCTIVPCTRFDNTKPSECQPSSVMSNGTDIFIVPDKVKLLLTVSSPESVISADSVSH
jgi:hypothetical protein